MNDWEYRYQRGYADGRNKGRMDPRLKHAPEYVEGFEEGERDYRDRLDLEDGGED